MRIHTFMVRLIISFLQALVTLGIMFWVFSGETMRHGVVAGLRGADHFWMILAVLCSGVSLITQTLRWRIFLRMQQLNLSLGRVGAISFVGVFFDLLFIGAAGGDTARVICLIKEYPDRKAAAFLSVVMDHMSGLLALVVAAGVFTLARRDYFLKSSLASGMVGIFTLYICISLSGILLCLLIARSGLPEKLNLPERPRRRMQEIDEAFGAATRQWRHSLVSVALSFVVLLSYFLSFYCSNRAVRGGVSLTDMLSVMPVVDVIASIPISISGLGVREKSFETLLSAIANVPAETAVLISLGGFACSLFLGLLGGLVFMFYRPSNPHERRLRWTEMKERKGLDA